MIRGRLVKLKILDDSDDSLEYFLSVGREERNVNNLTDRYIGNSIEDIKEGFDAMYNSVTSTDYLFAIEFRDKKIGLLYILTQPEKRTAEVEILLESENYRHMGLGFDAIYAAIVFCKNELNLHSITYRYAAHNEQMASAFRFSQLGYEQENENFNNGISKPDICYRGEFKSKGKVSDFYGYTFLLDDNVRISDVFDLSSGKHKKYKRQGRVQL